MNGNKLARVFRAYQRILSLESRILDLRGGRSGILVDTDHLAIQYQQRVVWRKEVIEAHFEGRAPNEYVKVWYTPNDGGKHDN